MTATEELVNYIMNFTEDQLEQFLNDETTLSILQPEGASESYLPEVPSSAQ